MSQDRFDDRGDAPQRPDVGLPPPPGPPDTELPASFTLEHMRARRVIGLLVVTSIALVVSIVAEVYLMGVLARVADDGFVTRSEADTIGAWILATGVLAAVLILVTGVAWLMWQHRAHVNVRNAAGGGGSLSFTPAWGAGCWFVPLANLILPYRAVAELARESSPGVKPTGDRPGRVTPAVIPAWWTAWILASILGWISARMTIGDEAEDSLKLVRLALASDVVAIVAAGLAVGVLRLIDHRQAALGRLLATGRLEEPAMDQPVTGPRSRTPAVIGSAAVVIVTAIAVGIAYSAGSSAPGTAPATRPSASAATIDEVWVLHEREGFSVALPEAWRIKERHAVALAAVDRATGTNILIYTEPIPSGITLDQYADASWEALSQAAGSKRTAEDEIVELPAGSAILISAETPSDPIPVRQVLYLLIQRSTGYGVLLTSGLRGIGDDATFDQIMESFRFVA
jgi:hypothetical protein